MTNTASDTIRMIAGVDVGNGYVKAKVQVAGEDRPHLVDMPSALAYTAQVPIPKNATAKLLDDLANEADVEISTDAVDALTQGRALFGRRAVRSGSTLSEFEIDSPRPKCEDGLSTMLLLDVVASEAIRAWSVARAEKGQTKDLPLPTSVITAKVTCAVALPIEDYVQWKDVYSTRLERGTHMVRFRDFEHPVDVRVEFDDVVIMAEGAAGQYAILALGPNFLDMALADSRARGLPVDEAYHGSDLVAATDTIGIDIGEGTVNFPVFSAGDVSVEASSSIRRGWGSVLSDVVVALRTSKSPFGSRKALADFLMVENPLPAKARLRAEVQRAVDDAARVFARELMGEFDSVWRRVGLRTDVVYVYGGGSVWMRDFLWPMLVEATTLSSGGAVPVVWLDGSYSRDLNRNGLFEAAKLADHTRGRS